MSNKQSFDCPLLIIYFTILLKRGLFILTLTTKGTKLIHKEHRGLFWIHALMIF